MMEDIDEYLIFVNNIKIDYKKTKWLELNNN